MKKITLWSFNFILIYSCSVLGAGRVWHAVLLEIEGPHTSEAATPNPFTDYRLDVIFEQGARHFAVPGFYAADGGARNTSAQEGNRWRVFFVPDEPGVWSYRVSFRTGKTIAISDDPKAGRPAAGNGIVGMFKIEEASAGRQPQVEGRTINDARQRGMLRYVGKRYLQFAGTGEYFIKAGADSPENFLAYAEFDGTYSIKAPGGPRSGEAALSQLHTYSPHLPDSRSGDPLWGSNSDRGQGILGALNYLASEGMNSVYFLTMNIAGDGQDVWPWISHTERFRFDCSKLDQWEAVFTHMDKLGLMLHVVLTETENESLFEVEEGATNFAQRRKLYYREMVARFAHHNMLVWNIGEENGWDDRKKESTGQSGRANSHEQRKAFAEYIRRLDPYDHPIVVHTLPGRYDEIYTPLLGHASYEGPSLQMGKMRETHEETKKWVSRSLEAGRPWHVCLDEIGPAHTGVKPDADDPRHDDVRRWALWGNLMAGGAGVEWYFGYKYPHNDLNCDDWRSRQRMWEQTRYALQFFQRHLPFQEMKPSDELVNKDNAWCLAKPGHVYAVYLGAGGTTKLRLPKADYRLSWYNPRTGEDLSGEDGFQMSPPGYVTLTPPKELEKDWVALLKLAGDPPAQTPSPPR
ncbi:DUF5060 domain-containing protein [Acidobacteria bacterium AH-259-G07]|nr:DUF5060 domain-containing protein [Acidobacteria bacterium AH-259-G07]